MNREYADGTHKDVVFFTGVEIEKTPALGKQTLFVTGIQDTSTIQIYFNSHNCEHIFFGANHSFNPKIGNEVCFEEWKSWEDMIEFFLKKDILCSLDIPISHAEEFLESGLVGYDNFIPQLRVPIPFIKLWNYNTMLKIDDRGFKASNPGVWTHSLHQLMDRDKFNDWSQYKVDKPL